MRNRAEYALFFYFMGNFVSHKVKPSGGSHYGGEEVLIRDHARQGIKNDRRMV